MQIFINGKAAYFKKALTIEQLLNDLKMNQGHGIAVALNTTVISKSDLAQTYLKDGDTLEIIHATAGG